FILLALCHEAISVPWYLEGWFRELVARDPGTVKSPRPAPGALAHTEGFSLPADLEAGSTTRAAVIGTVTVGDHLNPQCILALVVRGVSGFPERIEVALLRPRGCGGEPRQIKDHPRAAIQFRQGEGHGRPFGGHLDLGTGSYVGTGYVVLLAIAAENDWRLRSCPPSAPPTRAAPQTPPRRPRAVGAPAAGGRRAAPDRGAGS